MSGAETTPADQTPVDSHAEGGETGAVCPKTPSPTDIQERETIARIIDPALMNWTADGLKAVPPDVRNVVIDNRNRLYAKADAILALRSNPQPGEVERRRSALEFYANNYSWRSSTVYMCGHSGASSAELDRGNKARAALTPSESGEAVSPTPDQPKQEVKDV